MCSNWSFEEFFLLFSKPGLRIVSFSDCIICNIASHPMSHDWLNLFFLYFEMYTGRIPFAFLEDIHQRFVRTYGRAVLSAQAYAMNDEFSRVIGQQMEYYSNDPNADRINRLKGEMSQVIFLLSFRCTYGFRVSPCFWYICFKWICTVTNERNMH